MATPVDIKTPSKLAFLVDGAVVVGAAIVVEVVVCSMVVKDVVVVGTVVVVVDVVVGAGVCTGMLDIPVGEYPPPPPELGIVVGVSTITSALLDMILLPIMSFMVR